MTSDVSGAGSPPPPETAVRGGDLLRRRSFTAFLVGNSISAAGVHFQTIAQTLLMYRLTGSTFLVGVTVFTQFVGVFVCAPFSGAAADRYNRHHLLMALTAMLGAVNTLIAVLVAVDVITARSLLLFVLIAGLLHSFTQPVLQSLVPQLVAPREISTAIALSNTSFTVARTLGPITAAVIVATYGLPIAFAANAATSVVFIAALLLVRPRAVDRSARASGSFLDGVAIVRRTRQVAMALIALTGIAVVTEPINTLAPELVTTVYGVSDAYVGVLLGAFGLGATMTALFLGRFRRRPDVGMAMGFAAVGLGMAGLAMSSNVPMGFAAVVLVGGGYLQCVTTGMTVLLTSVEPSRHGRIMAIWSLAFFGSRPITAVLSGTVVSLTSLRFALAACAAVAITFTIVVGRGSGHAARSARWSQHV